MEREPGKRAASERLSKPERLRLQAYATGSFPAALPPEGLKAAVTSDPHLTPEEQAYVRKYLLSERGKENPTRPSKQRRRKLQAHLASRLREQGESNINQVIENDPTLPPHDKEYLRTFVRNQAETTKGHKAEARVVEAFQKAEEEGLLPPWIERYAPATPEEDAQGVDLWITTDITRIPLQVKSSRDSVKRAERNHPDIPAIAVDLSLAPDVLFKEVLSIVAERRINVWKSLIHSRS